MENKEAPPAPTPPPPPGMLVPPVEEPVDDEWGEDEEYENEEQCKVLYDFQGNAFGVSYIFRILMQNDQNK